MTAYTETVGSQTTIVNRSFNAANQLVTATDAASGTTSYTYDANGSLTRIRPPGVNAGEAGEQVYSYNQRSLLTGSAVGAGNNVYDPVADYLYDGDGNRVQQVDYSGSQAITVTYTNDNTGLSQVLIADNGTTQTANLYGLDLILQDDGSQTRILLPDGLGSVRQEMVAGAVNAVTTYKPYGNVLAQTGTGNTTYTFTGEQYDGATNLLYLRARYYNPNLKVFISRDPFSGIPEFPATQHGYSYVLNNSVNFTDPSGLICIFGFGNCDEEPDLATIPWRLIPGDFCLPGNLGCWGGSNYANWLDNNYYPSLPIQYTYNNMLSKPPDFRVTENAPFCNESWLAKRDLTTWLVNQMNTNATGETARTIRNFKQNGPDGWVAANAMWYTMVRGDAPWDFKPDIQREIGNQIILANTWYSYDVPANIHYGYVGRAIGFNRDWLLFGAGVAQIKAGTSDRNWGAWYFDDPSDYTAVQVGMDLFDRYRYNITESNLATVLEEHESLLKLAPAQIPPGATP